MKNFFNFKALGLSAILVIFALSGNAQKNDAFFNSFDDDDNYWNRGVGIAIGSGDITNQGVGEPAPLGSGLLVLTVVGAGYAVARRKRSLRKSTMLLLACAMIMGMTNCKKNIETINSVPTNKVHITLNVGDGSRANVDPTGGGTFATVQYENGDIMYVGYNNKYVGYMTYSAGGFSGDVEIAEPVGEQPLHFYYLGGKGYTPDMKDIATDKIYVDISDQGVVDISASVHRYPIISYAASNEFYPTGSGQYSARLLNKCAMVKFNVNKPEGYDQAGTCIVGLNNYVTVDFTTPNADGNGFSYSQVNDGAITIDSKIGDVWAVLLPQDNIQAGDDMTVFSGRRKGTRPALGTIAVNDYKPDGIALNVTTGFVPTGALNGLFKVNADGKMVIFSKANLKATTTDGWNTWTWRFKDTQYEYETAGEVGTNYANRTEVSLFSWATSGYNIRGDESGSYYYKPNITVVGNTSSFGPGGVSSIVGEYAKGDWGYNRISNNAYKQWRCLTSDEWTYLRANHTTRWVKITGVGSLGTSGRCYGVAILPYNSSATLSSEYTVAQWEAMESDYGAILFPVCGFRAKSGSNYTKITQVDTWGYYWSSTNGNMNNGTAYMVAASWSENNLRVPETNSHCYGMSVRLVCE